MICKDFAMRIIAIHLLNDYSGSPKVLMQLLKHWSEQQLEIQLYIGNPNKGFLSEIPKINYHYYGYSFARNPLVRFFKLFGSQFWLMLLLILRLKKGDIVYVNTVLPFGAAIAGWIRGCKVIYHLHETSVKPRLLKVFLFGVLKLTAIEIVYVSHFLAQQEPIAKKAHIIHNVLENDFMVQSQKNKNCHKANPVVLMICSLKPYKGIEVFWALAERNPKINFKLVLNATKGEVEAYYKGQKQPKNLILYTTQENTHPFYQEASIILNLSDTQLWVETFGLTILEGMCYGLPAIVPPVGGVVELVENGRNGYLIDSKNIDLISEKLNELISDKALYKKMSDNARAKSGHFSEANFKRKAMLLVSS
ncbi:glycosyltransferase family 4 protein [Pedobacter helvus]|uniref:Glycosyltransferase family 4 protein n=2 Tax=Pedobacter helvus TaxID=2563444 RepID=A0ABW9JJ59_9SPHI